MASRFVRNTLQRAGSGPALPAVASPPSFPALDLASDPSIARQVRANCREGTLSGPTAQLAPGFLQANLVVMEKQFAFDFLMFTLRNPKSCTFNSCTFFGIVNSNLLKKENANKNKTQ